MKIKYTTQLNAIIRKDELRNLLSEILDNLQFHPNIMDLYTNEYDRNNSRDEISYDKNYFLDNLELEEMNGFSYLRVKELYESDEKYEDSSRFKFNIIFHHDENVQCIFEWMDCLDPLQNFDYILKKNLIHEDNVVYCYSFDGADLIQQILDFDRDVIQPHEFEGNWGKACWRAGYMWIAAPVMFFGSGFFNAISKEKLLSYKYSSEVKIGSISLVKIVLFGLEENPRKFRDRQRSFWVYFELENTIRRFMVLTKSWFKEPLERRAIHKNAKKIKKNIKPRD